MKLDSVVKRNLQNCPKHVDTYGSQTMLLPGNRVQIGAWQLDTVSMGFLQGKHVPDHGWGHPTHLTWEQHHWTYF